MSEDDKTILMNLPLEEIATFRADPQFMASHEQELENASDVGAADVGAAKEWARDERRRCLAGRWFVPDGGHPAADDDEF